MMIMKNAGRELEKWALLTPEDRLGSHGSISTSSIDLDTGKELPKEFIKYLRSLFDILDEDRCGYIKLSDIECYWDVKGPSFSAMIDYLRDAAPSNGLINFETLCKGLKFVVHASNITASSRLSNPKQQDWTSDSSEDSFRLHEIATNDHFLNKIQPKDGPEEPKITAKTNLVGSNKLGSTSSVYCVGKPPTSSTNQQKQDGLRGGGQKIDMKSRSNQLEEELQVLKEGLTVIENARKWYFKRFTAVQEEKLLLQQSDKHSLEQFQYEMLLHKTRRKELNLNETVFKCYKENIQELNKYMTQLIETPHELLKTLPSRDECTSSTKEQLHQLRHEVSRKNSTIVQLEKEKSALIRDLFQARSTGSGGHTSVN